MTRSPLWADWAWVDGRWQASVLLEVDARGFWSSVSAGVAPPAAARRLPGPVLPGLVNGHSHAFQRAFAGLTERRECASDDFWSWRERMYSVALRITQAQMQAIAAQLYIELLRGGYTEVCEFHYLHHAPDGAPYPDPNTMCGALADAASAAGIGLTLLPVLYERAGFTQAGPHAEQRRFVGTPMQVHQLMRSIPAGPRINAGLAIHSLRAASAGSIAALLRLVDGEALPIHIHVAEQMREVEDCLAATGARPIEWLCRNLAPDARWQLVHATHATPAEIDAVARSGAGIVLCPGTEANLGDGIPELPAWLAAGVALAIGSDSQVTRNWPEELRWLEYAQRLTRRQRNVAATPQQPATAQRLFEAALAGGARSAGQSRWGLTAGARADALVLDARAPALCGIAPAQRLDALVFASGEPAFAEVLVAGETVLQGGKHVHQDAIAARFAQAMEQLWNTTPG